MGVLLLRQHKHGALMPVMRSAKQHQKEKEAAKLGISLLAMNILDRIETLRHNFWRDHGVWPDKLYISKAPYIELLTAIYSSPILFRDGRKVGEEYLDMKIINVFDRDHLNVAL